MIEPTDAQHVAWYKETARIGEPGNMLLAGHLNWWRVPDAVFFNLARLQPGDGIAIAGDGGDTSRYVVEWVRQLPSGEAPGDDVLGMTAWPAATLITCAGSWDATISSYEERTVVRARYVDDA